MQQSTRIIIPQFPNMSYSDKIFPDWELYIDVNNFMILGTCCQILSKKNRENMQSTTNYENIVSPLALGIFIRLFLLTT